MAALVKESAVLALKRVLPPVHDMALHHENEPDVTETVVTISDFESALHQVKPSALREVQDVGVALIGIDFSGCSIYHLE